MVNRQQDGIVLLTTMMMLVILSLLVLSLMQSVFLYIKSSRQIIENHQLFHQMEVLANQLDATACIVENKDPNQLIDLLSHDQGCLIEEKGHWYQYVIEDMGVYSCLQIMVNAAPQGSHHWLITLVSMQSPRILLQLRIARPAETTTCDVSLAHSIASGVISWRKLNVSLDRKGMRDKIFG